MSVTLALCEDPAQAIEDIYLATLGRVGGWSTAARMELLRRPRGPHPRLRGAGHGLDTDQGRDDHAEPRRATYAPRSPGCAPTPSISTCPGCASASRSSRPRTRSSTSDSAQLESTPAVDPSQVPQASASIHFGGREGPAQGHPYAHRQLLQPAAVVAAQGTRAAVTCRPKTKVVSSVDYYLLEGNARPRPFGAGDGIRSTCPKQSGGGPDLRRGRQVPAADGSATAGRPRAATGTNSRAVALHRQRYRRARSSRSVARRSPARPSTSPCRAPTMTWPLSTPGRPRTLTRDPAS